MTMEDLRNYAADNWPVLGAVVILTFAVASKSRRSSD